MPASTTYGAIARPRAGTVAAVLLPAQSPRGRLRMKSQLPGFASAILLMCLPGALSAAGTQRFDGTWQTTVSCEGARDALGYSFRFTSTVTHGVLHGLHGTAGQHSS